jgi:hypothetical protein
MALSNSSEPNDKSSLGATGNRQPQALLIDLRAIEDGEDQAALHAFGILDADLIARRTEAKRELEAGPGFGYARTSAKS